MVQVASFKTVSFVSDVLVKLARMFVLEGSLQPSLMFVVYATTKVCNALSILEIM
jgi:hypothetical protein